MSVILLSNHKELIKKTKSQSVVIAVLFSLSIVVVSSVFYFYYRDLHSQLIIMKAAMEKIKVRDNLLRSIQNQPLTINQGLNLADILIEECGDEIPLYMALAMINQESQFYPSAISNKGARGILQVMPETAKFYLDKSMQDPKYLHDISVGLRVGIRHLKALKKEHRGDWNKILAAYWTGKPSVVVAKKYIKDVMKDAERFKDE